MKAAIILAGGVGACSLLSGCLVLGYSSRGGFFLFPGTIGLLLLSLVLWLLLRNR